MLLVRVSTHLVLISLWFALSNCQIQGKVPSDPGKNEVTHRDLRRAMQDHHKILLVYGWSDPAYQEGLEEIVEQIDNNDWGLQVLLKHYSQVTREELSNSPVMLLGTPGENPWIKEFSELDLPFHFEEKSIQFDGREYGGEAMVFILSYYPNPLNVRLPINMVTSLNEKALWGVVQQRLIGMFWGGWNYEILKGRNRMVIGNFSQQPKNRWAVDLSQEMTLPADVSESWDGPPYKFHCYEELMVADSIRDFQIHCQQSALRIQEFAAPKVLASQAIDYYLYPSTEIKGLMTGNTEQSQVDFDQPAIHTVIGRHYQQRMQGKENQLLIRQLLGGAAHKFLEAGLGVYFTEAWEKEGFRYWAKHLIMGGNGLTLSQLMDDGNSAYTSSLIRDALSASAVDFMISNWGRELFLERFNSWEPSADELETLTHSWWSWVSQYNVPMVSSKPSQLPYLRGFNFTHEGYQIYNGYGSRLSEASLQHLNKIGSNAVAIVPYSGMRDPKAPAPLRFSESAGGENDEGVIHAIHEAQALGMVTILKPHIWIRGGWPGDISMATDEEWAAFFDNYFHWISHYALMAEMHEADMLCVGVEFAQATLMQETRWRELIARLRNIYSGKLIYAANWGEEFENLPFWDALDYIGLNCYYPLSLKDDPSMMQLQSGFEKALVKAKQVHDRFQKPVIITEIGFRSVDGPWQQPHAEAGSRAYNEEHQARAYDAVFRALQGDKTIAGLLWWKWPTVMENQYPEDRRFIPYGKKAEKVIEAHFIKMKNTPSP